MEKGEIEEIKRHFGVIADGLRNEIRQVAEGHEVIRNEIRTLREENEQAHREILMDVVLQAHTYTINPRDIKIVQLSPFIV